MTKGGQINTWMLRVLIFISIMRQLIHWEDLTREYSYILGKFFTNDWMTKRNVSKPMRTLHILYMVCFFTTNLKTFIAAFF